MANIGNMFIHDGRMDIDQQSVLHDLNRVVVNNKNVSTVTKGVQKVTNNVINDMTKVMAPKVLQIADMGATNIQDVLKNGILMFPNIKSTPQVMAQTILGQLLVLPMELFKIIMQRTQ